MLFLKCPICSFERQCIKNNLKKLKQGPCLRITADFSDKVSHHERDRDGESPILKHSVFCKSGVIEELCY